LPPPPKKKKKLKVPRPLVEDAAGDDTDGGNAGGAGGGSPKEVEILFRMHPIMNERCKDVVTAMRETGTRYIKTISKALIEHLCKYLAMRISLDMPPQLAQQHKPMAGSSHEGSSENGKPNLVKDLIIYIGPTPGNIIELAGSLSLAQVNEKYWRINKPLEM
jgi:E3 ubiquitin-protein ligase RNF1/2